MFGVAATSDLDAPPGTLLATFRGAVDRFWESKLEQASIASDHAAVRVRSRARAG
jgi:hypothetical protein